MLNLKIKLVKYFNFGGNMSTYTFIKDYKNDEKYRLSFNNLAQKTFGIDFESWYQQGFWNDNYVCYSYLEQDEIVSNVSLSTMKLVIDGKLQKAIQIGTVMTNPEHRRQGLAYELLGKILQDYSEEYDMFFLAADDEAVPLYKKCGFKYREENKYIIDVSKYNKIETPLKPFYMKPKELIESKKQSQPLSNVLSAVEDEHVLMFYYTLGFKESIYRPVKDVHAIFDIEGDTLNLYDILSPRKVKLQELIEQIIPEHVKRVFCHFTPDQNLDGLTDAIDTESKWMVHGKCYKVFPRGARFPRISQT